MRRPWKLDLVWATLPFALVAIGFGVQPLKSWDFWWHIAFGRQIDATGAMPLVNHFLYTLPADHPSYVQAWLAQWGLFLLHESLGVHGVLIVRNLMAAGTFGLLGLWASKRAASTQTGTLLALIGAAFGFFTIALRSELFAWPIFLGLMWVSYGLRHGDRRSLWLLSFPIASALWANLHGTFVFAGAMCFCFGIAGLMDRIFTISQKSAELRDLGPSPLSWGLTGLASFATALVNPRGTDVYAYLLNSSNPEIRQTVSEWWPTTPFFPDVYGAFFWALLIAGVALMVIKRRELDYADLGMLSWMVLLVIPQSRFLLFFGFVIPIVLAPYLRRKSSTNESPALAAEFVHAGVAVALIVGALAIQPWSGSNQLAAETQAAPTRTTSPFLGLIHDDSPVESIGLIKERYAHKPRLFHDHRYPGFLLHFLGEATPSQMVFVDNRIELPTSELWREFDAIGRGENWESAFAKWGIEAVVTSYQNHSGLIAALKEDATWDCVFDNGSFVVCFPDST